MTGYYKHDAISTSVQQKANTAPTHITYLLTYLLGANYISTLVIGTNTCLTATQQSPSKPGFTSSILILNLHWSSSWASSPNRSKLCCDRFL